MLYRNDYIRSHGLRFRLVNSKNNEWQLVSDSSNDIVAVFQRTEFKEYVSATVDISILTDEHELLVISTFFMVMLNLFLPSLSSGSAG